MKTILVITLSNIGDVILTTPVISALKTQFPESQLTVVVGPRAKGILENSQMIDELVVYDKKLGWLGRLQFVLSLRKKSYDLVVDLRNTAIPFLVSARKRSPLFRSRQGISMRDRHLEILKKMGLSVELEKPFDFFSSEEESSALKKIQSIMHPDFESWIMVAPVAASSLKSWRFEGFREVIQNLLEDYAEPIVLVGDKSAFEQAEKLSKLHPSRVVNMTGETSLRELAALVSRSSLLLTNDSAIMHLGYELSCPVVSIFGPTDPEKYGRVGPLFKIIRENLDCSPCELAQCRFSVQHCFENIPSEQVYLACRELLRHAPKS